MVANGNCSLRILGSTQEGERCKLEGRCWLKESYVFSGTDSQACLKAVGKSVVQTMNKRNRVTDNVRPLRSWEGQEFKHGEKAWSWL